jgi:hypothetical protein
VKLRLALGLVLSIIVLTMTGVAQTNDPVVGTWELNLKKSKYVPGPLPQCETRVYETNGKQLIVSVSSIGADGNTTVARSTYVYDGKDYAVTGNLDFDSQAITQIDRYEIKSTLKKSGKVVQTGTRRVSQDGKTLTVTFTGTNAKGEKVNQLLVYDRR